jgi:hypothetical protein
MGRNRRRQQIVTGAGVSVGATPLMSGTAHADVFTVDGLQDAPDDGHTTLRDAIADGENPAASGSTITVKKEVVQVEGAQALRRERQEAEVQDKTEEERVKGSPDASKDLVRVRARDSRVGAGSAGRRLRRHDPG